MSQRTILIVALSLSLLVPATGRAQTEPVQPDLAIDVATRAAVIEGALKFLNESYVLPDVARQMDKAIRQRLKNKEYDKIDSAQALAKTLTDHLRAVCHDLHLRVQYSHRVLPPEPGGAGQGPTPEMRERMRRYMASSNYEFKKLERLDGNVGYLELEGFAPTDGGAEIAIAAMNFLANTDALIIDLRQNHGGGPGMVALICSYLFDPEPVHLNDLYFRPEDSTHQWWTLAYVPGKRYTGKDVYVLTSKETFSAAEEFTYNLKTRKRATIVGETTGGGANPGGAQRINDHFSIWVPSGRAINPITKTNWEGTGVAPDLAVPAARALLSAHLAAVKAIAEKASARRRANTSGPDPVEERREHQLRQTIERLEKELSTAKETPSAFHGVTQNGIRPAL
jgi:retinol-binding protein 3